MKTIKLIATVILFTLITIKAFGTSQAPEFLIYKGDTLLIFAAPLESYFKHNSRPDSVFYKYGLNSTAYSRGYIGYWELKNDSLFLIELRGDSGKIDLSLIFKDKSNGARIFADWVNDSINNPYGKLIYYSALGYDLIYEFERDFMFKNGVLTKIKEYDNTKTKRSKFTEKPKLFWQYIQSNISYNNITSDHLKSARVIVQIHSVTAEGKIDSVKVIRGADFERDQEAVRVVKSIPYWDVVYKRGKQIQLKYVFPVVFGKKEDNNLDISEG